MAKHRVGSPFPVVIDYDLGFRQPRPLPGVLYPVWGEAWFEDEATGLPVDGYSFEVTLATKERETATGSLAWDAQIMGPGSYTLKHHLLYRTPLGNWAGMSSGSTSGIKITEGE